MKIKEMLEKELYMEQVSLLAHQCNIEGLSPSETKEKFKKSFRGSLANPQARKRVWDTIPYYVEESSLNVLFKYIGAVAFYVIITSIGEERSLRIGEVDVTTSTQGAIVKVPCGSDDYVEYIILKK